MAQINEATHVKQFAVDSKFQEAFDAWRKWLENSDRLAGPEEQAPGRLRILGEEPIIAKDGATTGLLIFYRVADFER